MTRTRSLYRPASFTSKKQPARGYGMETHEDIRKQLKELFHRRQLAVLSTQQDGQPYASLIAFTVEDNLRHLYFVTPRTTRKFQNLSASPKVALLINDSENRETDFHRAIAVTIVGWAEEIAGTEREKSLATYLTRHPHLEDFAAAPTSALIRVTIRSFYMVRRFQQVMELHINQ